MKKNYWLKRVLIGGLLSAVLLSSCGHGNNAGKDAGKDSGKNNAPSQTPMSTVSKLKGITEQFKGRVQKGSNVYDLIISISEGYVGVSVEETKDGFLYLGMSKEYTEKGAALSISIDAANTRKEVAETKKLVIEYRGKENTVKVVSFDGEAQNCVLAGEKDKQSQALRWYTVAVKQVPFIGDAVVSVAIKDRHVSAAAVQSGKSSGAVAAVYKGVGYVKSGAQVVVEIPVDNSDVKQAKQIIRLEGRMLGDKLHDVTTIAVSRMDDGDPLKPHAYPLFSPLKIPFKKTAATAVNGNLVLTVMRRQDGIDGKEHYYMTAQFEAWKADAPSAKVVSKQVVAKAEPYGTDADDAALHPDRYKFVLKGFKDTDSVHALCQADIVITIADWRPVDLKDSSGAALGTEPAEKENVSTNGFKITIQKANAAGTLTALEDGDNLVAASVTELGSAAVAFKDFVLTKKTSSGASQNLKSIAGGAASEYFDEIFKESW